MALTDILRDCAQLFATVVEGIGVLIVALAVLLAVGRYGRAALARARPFPPETLRLDSADDILKSCVVTRDGEVKLGVMG